MSEVAYALSWARDNPTRVAGFLALGACAVVLLIAGLSPDNGPATDTPDKPLPTPFSSTPTPGPPTRTAGPREAASDAARHYAIAFFDKTGTDAQWHDRINTYSTTGLADLNSTVPRSEVPRARVTSLRVTGIKPDYAEVEARTDTGMRLFIAVVLDADQWRVNEFAPIT